jgi:ribosome-associated protein
MEIDILLRELKFKAIRSSGPGGQHLNKTASKIELNFYIEASQALSNTEKERLQKKLRSRISQDGVISLQCGETRSQHRNKGIAIERLVTLLKENLKIAKARKKTKPSKSAIERRLKVKKAQAKKKSARKPPPID